jgi:hypothetical protein
VLPLNEFNWNEQKANASNIKQIIFNLVAEGELYIDEIRIVPYEGGYRKRAIVSNQMDLDFRVDGEKNDSLWSAPAYSIGENDIHLGLKGDVLCLALEVKDDTPFQNKHTGPDSYRGDGFEIAFSSDPKAYNNRIRFLYSDQHLGFAFGDEISVYDYRKKRSLSGLKTARKITAQGYLFEAEIPLSRLDIPPFSEGELYGLEMAINKGDENERKEQLRWNNPDAAGYSENPALWGELYLLGVETAN